MEQAYTQGSLVLGTSWQVIVNTLVSGRTRRWPVETGLAGGGFHGVVRQLDAQLRSRTPNSAYMWMNYIVVAEGEGRRWRRGSGGAG